LARAAATFACDSSEKRHENRAAVCRAFGQPLTIEEIELAEPGPGELRVKIKACAICHSDIFYADGAWAATFRPSTAMSAGVWKPSAQASSA